MDIRIITKNTSLTESLDSYIREKVQVFERHFNNITRIEVELEVFKNKHHGHDMSRAEVIVHIPGRMVRADEQGGEMHEAFDLVVPKIDKQLEKYKAKLRKRDRGFLAKMGTVFSPLFNRSNSSKASGDIADDEGDYEE